MEGLVVSTDLQIKTMFFGEEKNDKNLLLKHQWQNTKDCLYSYGTKLTIQTKWGINVYQESKWF